MHTIIWPIERYVSHMCALCQWKSEKGVGCPETGVVDGFFEPNLGSLQKQQVLIITEPSLDFFLDHINELPRSEVREVIPST